ncbi:recombinase family protein [Microbacterium sp. ET2]|uniref:recombinase family protein n=1 Tax=Microbacterium albipurpureum TaxID=3050384 RepID=UPI00259C9761|nr:recombinase family protein [Microbacterium sp. ET2 (Ac-2212)]WJL95856.1 recombinase family protein [Microbacterium sp. ET2 (Ac-2212)]
MTVIYCRISQDRTGEKVKVERQLRECRALAAKLELTVEHVYTDNDVSATSGKVRPQFEAMLAARPKAIIAWHQDRLLRLTSDLEKVIALDVPVYTVTAGTLDLSTPAGRAVARTVAAWSQYEGEQKAKRQVSGNVERAEKGVYQFSRRPYGYKRVEKKVVIVEKEAEIVREGYKRYLDGDSYYSIAQDWNDRGVPTFSGPWSMARVRAMLRNPAYVGELHYKGEHVGAGDWKPIIDRDTWDAYLRMRGRRKRAGDWSTQTKHLLSGIIFCGVCGSRMLARPDRGVMKYSCTTNWCTTRRASDVEAVVEGVVIARLQDPEIVSRIRQAPDLAPLEDELVTLRSRRDDLAAMLAEGLLSREAVKDQAQALTTKIDALTRRLDAARSQSPVTDLALAASVPDRWAQLTLPTKRLVIQSLLKVRVQKTRPGRVPFDPTSVEIEWVSEGP